MKNTKALRNRIIAGMLAIITTFSALAVTASADDTQITAPETAITETADETPAENEAPAEDEAPADEIPANDEFEPEAPSGKLEKEEEVTIEEAPAIELPEEKDLDELYCELTKATEKAPEAKEVTPDNEMKPVESGAVNEIKPYELDSEVNGEETEETEGPSDEEIEALTRKLMGAFTEAGLDMLGDSFPGAKFISEPLKAILGDMIGGEDATEAALRQLAEENRQQYEDLKNRIEDLHKDINKYTKGLEKDITSQTDKQTLGGLFKTLSANLNDLSSKVKSIMNNTSYTPEQKLILLADLNNKNGYGSGYLENVRQAADMIGTTISNNGTKLDVDLYNTLYELCARNYMFAGAAHEEAMISANALTEEYMYANALLLQCQNAANALNASNLTPEQIEELCTDPVVRAAYERFVSSKDKSFDNDKFNETIKRINGCVAGYKTFSDKKQEGNRYINNGTQEDEIVLDFYKRNYSYIKGGDLEKMYKEQQFFKGDEINKFVDYIHTTTGGQKSIAQFLEENNQEITTVKTASDFNISSGTKGNEPCYIIVDPTITTTTKLRPSNVIFGASNDYYDCTETIKVVDINDPECKVQEIVIRTYEKERSYVGNIFIRDVKNVPHNFLTIGSHTATADDNIKEKTNNNGGLDIKGPKKEIIDESTFNTPKVGKGGIGGPSKRK